ncbi:MAG: molybdopterin-dependent oxidoreductase [Thermodesulfovibrionales bacterium]|nr:molybdopterin-dependent oxidoreductase [Thermodesulfovibrionales bacterium]
MHKIAGKRGAVKRRDFLKIAGGIMASTILPSCLSNNVPLLKNEDRPGFYIRFYRPFRPVDIRKWRLEVSGLCYNPLKLDIKEIMEFEQHTQVSRLKCVECWSAKASWTGFKPELLFNMVKPRKEAKYLYFYAADDYFEYISIEDLLKPSVLFVHTMNGRPLLPEYGAPLRLIIPFKYGYKNVKTITKLVFVEKGGEGYWSQFGYSSEGTIQPGHDYLLDTGETIEIKKPGELDY